MRLLLVRHGESTWNASGQWQGQADPPLSPRGQLQARALAARAYEVSFDARLTSDLTRARETAAALSAEAAPDPRFREIDVGRWAGLSRAEVAEQFPDEVAKLRAGEPVRIGGGESMAEFEGRVDSAIDALRASHARQRVLLVTHGGVVRALATRVLGLRDGPSPLVGVANTSVSALHDREGSLIITRYNDAAHLEAADRDAASMGGYTSARAALIACEADETEPDPRLADRILAALGIAQFFALPSVARAPLAEALLAEPVDGDATAALATLRDAHEAFALLAPASEIQRAVTASLGARHPEGLAIPRHGEVAQLRLGAGGAVLHSYGVALGEVDPLA